MYLVQHGESEGNTKNVFQSESVPLSGEGEKQSLKLAEILKGVEFEFFVSSSAKRALQTSEIIKKATGKNYLSSNLFVEIKKPKIFHGLSVEKSREMLKDWVEAFFLGKKIIGGESYKEVERRAEKVLEFFKNKKEGLILVVTHGGFLRILLAKAIFGSNLTGAVAKDFWFNTSVGNTGITILKYFEKYWDGNPRWLLWVFNDYSHLNK